MFSRRSSSHQQRESTPATSHHPQPFIKTSFQPLTRASPLLDKELYSLIDLIFRDFLLPWFRPLSDDTEFFDEVIRCISVAVKEIERRCRKADFVSLLARDCPHLLRQQYIDYRRCSSMLGTSLAGHRSLEELFLGLRPHFALAGSPASAQEAEYLRQLADSLLLLLLPSEEYTSECTRYLVREVLSRRVLSIIIEILSEPDLVNEAVVKVLCKDSVSILSGIERVKADDDKANMTKGRSQQTMDATAVMSSFEKTKSEKRNNMNPLSRQPSSSSPLQNDLSRMLLEAQMTELSGSAAQQPSLLISLLKPLTRETVVASTSSKSELAGNSNSEPESPKINPSIATPFPPTDTGCPIPPSFPLHVNAHILIFEPLLFHLRWLWIAFSAFVLNLLSHFSFIRRPTTAEITQGSVFGALSGVGRGRRTASLAELFGADHSRLEEPICALVDEAFCLSAKNWWLSAQIQFFVFPIFRLLAGGPLDGLIVDCIHHLLSEHFLVYYVQMIKYVLWPHGVRAGKSASRTPAQSEALRVAAVQAITSSLPNGVKVAFFGFSPTAHLQIAEDVLEPFQHKALNKHLIYAALDVLVERLTPELVDPLVENRFV